MFAPSRSEAWADDGLTIKVSTFMMNARDATASRVWRIALQFRPSLIGILGHRVLRHSRATGI